MIAILLLAFTFVTVESAGDTCLETATQLGYSNGECGPAWNVNYTTIYLKCPVNTYVTQVTQVLGEAFGYYRGVVQTRITCSDGTTSTGPIPATVSGDISNFNTSMISYSASGGFRIIYGFVACFTDWMAWDTAIISGKGTPIFQCANPDERISQVRIGAGTLLINWRFCCTRLNPSPSLLSPSPRPPSPRPPSPRPRRPRSPSRRPT
ncbi:hypothetical protein Vafri_15930 [Volvox africanus]|uniref:Uncharacterized protein n=1 Tax=Volvox africanus TaxID=51714 RepID=A0A8J4BM64_9CHLO|nr:hypothetical protein Vafri_15930 [Volvox africanus]